MLDVTVVFSADDTLVLELDTETFALSFATVGDGTVVTSKMAAFVALLVPPLKIANKMEPAVERIQTTMMNTCMTRVVFHPVDGDDVR
jgi:hypothetical protein